MVLNNSRTPSRIFVQFIAKAIKKSSIALSFKAGRNSIINNPLTPFSKGDIFNPATVCIATAIKKITSNID